MNETGRLDVVVRFHDLTRISDLERCIFSLVGQDYRPLHINLVVQRFSEADKDVVRSRLAPLLMGEQSPSLEILNWDHEAPVDARSALINMGIHASTGRYLAFLDFDHVLYPEAYRLLISQLELTGTDLAFARVRNVEVEVYDTFLRPKAVLPGAEGKGLHDLFRGNYFPIHSYVIDRSGIPEQFLFFDPNLTAEEDYDFLLRICAQFQSDFTLAQIEIGECSMKTGDGNHRSAGGRKPMQQAQDEHVAAFLEQRRRNTLLSQQVQRTLGVTLSRKDLTIRSLLDRELC